MPHTSLLGCAFALSFLVNVLAGFVILLLCIGLTFRTSLDTDSSSSLSEKFHSGTRTAKNKVAIVSIDGVLMEGLLGHVHKQLTQAGKDDSVKAVVLRINSPGGSITASDDLHRRISSIIKGDEDKKFTKKPVLVSMASLAASGGYFIAVPAQKIFAETSTITGSIGVYASFPNLKELGQKVGISMTTIKAGAIKDAGSLFGEMKPSEQQVFQDMVNDAYDQFLQVVQKGRSKLTRELLLERFQVQPLRPDPQADLPPPAPYTRYRADGGLFTARRALELGLIDAIGSLDDAVKAAAQAAALDSYKAIRYQKPITLRDILVGTQSPSRTPTGLLGDQLRQVLTPRLWYLAPGHEGAAWLSVARSQNEP